MSIVARVALAIVVVAIALPTAPPLPSSRDELRHAPGSA